jgi:hypothetical protein
MPLDVRGEIAKDRSMSPRLKASVARRKISTFSSDIALLP